jgi:hypothetical protein
LGRRYKEGLRFKVEGIRQGVRHREEEARHKVQEGRDKAQEEVSLTKIDENPLYIYVS